MTRALALALVFGLAALAHAAAAQERVFRCGDSYSRQPCADGAAIDVGDARSAQQFAQAQQVARRDAQAADALARQRDRAEQAAARQGPATFGAPAHAAHDVPCRPGKPCAREHPRARRDKAERVTLYRAPGSN